MKTKPIKEEIWEDIEEYEGYQISSIGNIKSISGKFKSKKDKLLSRRIDKDGYVICAIYKNQKRKDFKIHRLVAKAFIPNPENKSMVNHKDGIKDHNWVDNLEWCTQGENEKHAYRTGLKSHKGENHPYHKLTQKNVDEIRKRHSNEGLTRKYLSAIFNVSTSQITRIINHTNW